MIVGATPESDYQMMIVAEALYQRFGLKHVFYSAFVKTNEDSALPDLPGGPPLLREHRLYQADWLLRYYGFHASELLTEERPNFNVLLDPKCDWALRHLELFPILIYGFHMGKDVMDAIQLPAVYELFRLNRAVGNEAHLLTEFLRFSELPGKVLLGRIGPKNDVTVLLMPHFSDRMREERFLIYDEVRKKAGVHICGMRWYLLEGKEAEQLEALVQHSDAGSYEKLWRTFFHSVSIPERENYVCQRGHLPLRYRSYMTEFQRPGESN